MFLKQQHRHNTGIDRAVIGGHAGNTRRWFSHVEGVGVSQAADNLQKLRTLITDAALYSVEKGADGCC